MVSFTLLMQVSYLFPYLCRWLVSHYNLALMNRKIRPLLTPHALGSGHGFLLLQLRRYSVEDGSVCKNQRGISVLPGQIFGVPVFLRHDSLERIMRSCRVVFVIYRCGNSVLSGHYMIGLSTPSHLFGLTVRQWKFPICDDNNPPTRASARDMQLMAENGYLVGAVRSHE